MQRDLRSASRYFDPLWLIAAGDMLVSAAAFYVATLLRFSGDMGAAADWLGPIMPRAASFALCIMLGLLSMGMYRDRQRPRLWESVARVSVAVVIGGLADVLLFYLIPDLVTGRGVLALAMGITWVLLSGTRLALLRLVDFNPVKRRVLVVGSGRIAHRVGMLRRRADRRRFDVVGYVFSSDAERELGEKLGLQPLLPMTAELHSQPLDQIVVALDDRRGTFPTRQLLEHKFRGVPVTDIVEFLEAETEKIDLDVLYPGWLVFSNSCHTGVAYVAAKRALDLAIASVLLILTSPLLLLAWATIKFEDGPRAPVFYRQVRVGKDEVPFQLLKFRSMRTDAEAGQGPQWSSGAGDDRVTSTGRLLRRFRVDELPQLINVMRGEMSIVGPRPERPEFVRELSEQVPLYNFRHCVPPGLTGWAQLNFPYGASIADAREKLKYDLYYIKNANIVFDIFVLLQTVEVVFWGRAISMAGSQNFVADAMDEPRSRDFPDLAGGDAAARDKRRDVA